MNIALACLLSAGVAAPTGDATVRTVGYAYDLETNQYLFTELSEDRFAGGRWAGGWVSYIGPDGREFGHKVAQPGNDSLVPLYSLTFPQPAYTEGITGNGEQIVMLRRDGETPRTGTIAKDGIVVADAGIADLLSAHLDELARGDTLHFRIAAPSQLDTYKFRAQHIANTRFEDQAAVEIRVDMDSVLRLFTRPLTFVFNSATRKLVEFRGLTDILDPRTGKAFAVRMSYPSARPHDAPPLPP